MIGYYNCVYVITYSIQYTYDRMLCIYIYSHPEVDRISEIFKKDFFLNK